MNCILRNVASDEQDVLCNTREEKENVWSFIIKGQVNNGILMAVFTTMQHSETGLKSSRTVHTFICMAFDACLHKQLRQILYVVRWLRFHVLGKYLKVRILNKFGNTDSLCRRRKQFPQFRFEISNRRISPAVLKQISHKIVCSDERTNLFFASTSRLKLSNALRFNKSSLVAFLACETF